MFYGLWVVVESIHPLVSFFFSISTGNSICAGRAEGVGAEGESGQGGVVCVPPPAPPGERDALNARFVN
jgi:hypothetical protein